MLKVIDIDTYYGESQIVHGASLEVGDGSIVALLGRNGAGKTTVINSVIGFTPPRRGKVIFNGIDLTGLKPYQIPLTGLALVPQGQRIFPSLSVKETLTMAARDRGKPDAWTLDKVYSLFPILKERARISSRLLSGGEQQMLSVGRALMTNADLLLMDEPSQGLAPLVVNELSGVIRRLNRMGLSILLVEQNLRLAFSVAEYIYIISGGVIVYESTPEKLRNNKEVMLRYLGPGAKAVAR